MELPTVSICAPQRPGKVNKRRSRPPSAAAAAATLTRRLRTRTRLRRANTALSGPVAVRIFFVRRMLSAVKGVADRLQPRLVVPASEAVAEAKPDAVAELEEVAVSDAVAKPDLVDEPVVVAEAHVADDPEAPAKSVPSDVTVKRSTRLPPLVDSSPFVDSSSSPSVPLQVA